MNSNFRMGEVKLPRENVYRCPAGHLTVTVDVDEGVTPFIITCRSGSCQEAASSSFYPKSPRPAQIPAPEWEWYRPTDKQAKKKDRQFPGTWDHVRNGGLLIRPRTSRDPVYHKEEE